MQWIRETCGREIAAATGDDAARTALLAAIAASESRGCRQAYRFAPANHERLLALLKGSEKKVDGLTRARLEKRLRVARTPAERNELLKKLAGLHGYTLLAGYFSILWEEPLEAFTDKSRHFLLAARRLDELCRELELDPAQDAAELGRRWNGEHLDRSVRSALYAWRLQERRRLYLESLEGWGWQGDFTAAQR